MHAIKTLNLQKLVMLTPYNDDLTQREIDWLKKGDVEVIDYHFRDIPDNLGRGAQYPEDSFECVRKMNWREADGILLSCANVRSLEIIEKLEKHTGKPVVSSSLATTWMALRKCGIKDTIQGYGCLLKI